MESGAILIYLADKTGRLLPKAGERRYRVHRMADVADGRPGPDVRPGASLREIQQGKAPYAEERYLKEAHRLYGVLDRRLAEHEFVADDYSIADIAIWPWVSRYEWQTVDLNALSEREALVHGDRQAPRRAARLQGAEGRRRDPDAVNRA